MVQLLNVEVVFIFTCFFFFLLSEEDEEATHVVFDEQDPLDDEFARAVMRRDRQTLFHFYYMPDSYDSWATGVELDYDPPDSPQFFDGQWKVGLHFWYSVFRFMRSWTKSIELNYR